MKRFLFLCAASLLAAAACGQPSVRIAHGPYLQQVSEDGFTVAWTTTVEAAAWVEVAPDDGTHFYAQARPEILRHPHRQTPHRAVAPRPRRGIAPRHDLPLPNHAAGRAPRRGQQARHTGRGVRQRHTQTRTVQSHDARPVQGADRMLGRERHPRAGLDPAAASGRALTPPRRPRPRAAPPRPPARPPRPPAPKPSPPSPAQSPPSSSGPCPSPPSTAPPSSASRRYR